MFEIDITYKSQKRVVKGPENFKAAALQDLFDFIVVNHVEIHEAILEDFQKKKLFPVDEKRFATFVDGKRTKDKFKVKPFGKIVDTKKVEDFTKVILFAYQKLLEQQIKLTGYYSQNNWLVYNGDVVAKDIFSVNSFLQKAPLENGDRIRIINMSPYARKLEREGRKVSLAKKTFGQSLGTKRQKKSKATGGQILAANGAFWRTTGQIKRKFPVLKNSVRFSYIPVEGSVASRLNSKNFSRYNFKKDGRPYLYPSISFIIGDGNTFKTNAGLTESGANL